VAVRRVCGDGDSGALSAEAGGCQQWAFYVRVIPSYLRVFRAQCYPTVHVPVRLTFIGSAERSARRKRAGLLLQRAQLRLLPIVMCGVAELSAVWVHPMILIGQSFAIFRNRIRVYCGPSAVILLTTAHAQCPCIQTLENADCRGIVPRWSRLAIELPHVLLGAQLSIGIPHSEDESIRVHRRGFYAYANRCRWRHAFRFRLVYAPVAYMRVGDLRTPEEESTDQHERTQHARILSRGSQVRSRLTWRLRFFECGRASRA
jgi:hypothetical protein